MVSSKKKEEKILSELDFGDLIAIIKKTGRRKSKYDVNDAYSEIEIRLRSRLKQISYKFFIPGLSHDDIYQESLFALRYKAIKDYDKTKSRDGKLYPFEKFVILCVRRHLATQLKSSFQNKKKVLNSSISLNQDRNDFDNDDFLSLVDILADGNQSILDKLEEKEYYNRLFRQLFLRLSKFEKKVFILYIHKYSYENMSDVINKRYKKNKIRHRINIKSIDNALSRVKSKAKKIFNKFG